MSSSAYSTWYIGYLWLIDRFKTALDNVMCNVPFWQIQNCSRQCNVQRAPPLDTSTLFCNHFHCASISTPIHPCCSPSQPFALLLFQPTSSSLKSCWSLPSCPPRWPLICCQSWPSPLSELGEELLPTPTGSWSPSPWAPLGHHSLHWPARDLQNTTHLLGLSSTVSQLHCSKETAGSSLK